MTVRTQTGLSAGLKALPFAVALAAAVSGAHAQAPQEQPVQEQPAEIQTPQNNPGFKVVVVGEAEGMSSSAFASAVIDAIPPDLLDRERNFTQDPAYREDQDYRLVIVFHGSDALDARSLCRTAAQEPETVEAQPSEMSSLMTTTRVTSAFCQGERTLTTATDRMVGAIQPGQASFNFLVSDVTKQLFPEGFTLVPNATASTASDG